MYKYSSSFYIEQPIDDCDMDYHFKINLKEKMYFRIGECYVKIYKNHHHGFKQSDMLQIEYYSNDNTIHKNAEIKIRETIEFIIFLTDIPFETIIRLQLAESSNHPNIDINMSKLKMSKILTINNQYLSITTGQRSLFIRSIKLYSKATRLNYLASYLSYEDSFFMCFKILENISNDTFKKNINEVDIDVNIFANFVSTICHNNYNIISTESKCKEFGNKLKALLSKAIKEDTFHRVMFTFAYYKINVDSSKILKAVKFRNKIAHGDSINEDETIIHFQYIYPKVKQLIHKKYFPTIRSLELPHSIESIIDEY